MDMDMKIELGKIQKDLTEVDDKVTGILAFLRGNELDKDDRGMVGTVNDLKKRVEYLEKWKDRIFYIMVGMALPAGVGTWELFKNIFTSKI